MKDELTQDQWKTQQTQIFTEKEICVECGGEVEQKFAAALG